MSPMKGLIALLPVGLLIVASGCSESSPDKQWYKPNSNYTRADFERDRADRSLRGSLETGVPEPLAALHRHRVVVAEALAARERERAGPGEQDVRGLFHHLARDEDGILHAPDRRDPAAAQPLADHHRGVHLRFAVAGERGPGAGVEERIVLEDDHGRADGVERRAAAGKDLAPRLEGYSHAAQRGARVSSIPTAAAAVHDDRIARHGSIRRPRALIAPWLRAPSRPCARRRA